MKYYSHKSHSQNTTTNNSNYLELINTEQVNEAFARLEKRDVKYRFVIDMADLKK